MFLFLVLIVTVMKRCSNFLGKVQANEVWNRRIIAVISIQIGLYFTARLVSGLCEYIYLFMIITYYAYPAIPDHFWQDRYGKCKGWTEILTGHRYGIT